METVGIILAAGKGSRLSALAEDKALYPLRGIPCFYYSVKVFLESGLFDRLVMVYRNESQRHEMELYLGKNVTEPIKIDWVQGGERRQDSVYAALKVLKPLTTKNVFIHDSARPLIQVEGLQLLNEILTKIDAATLVNPVVDTIKVVEDVAEKNDVFTKLIDIDRNRLRAMQTPQAFRFELIKEAYDYVFANDLEITDDVSAAVIKGHKIGLVNNPFPNPKLTYLSDVAYLEFLLSETVSLS